MTFTRILLLCFVAVLVRLAACNASPVAQPAADENRPRGIVLVVGDGMGSAHFKLARILRGDEYAIGQLPYTGLVATAAADRLVTDSAAAATAYATGVKTNAGYVGVDPSGASHPTVLEIAEQQGLATGLVSTARFGDATPAAFAAHVTSRRELAVIARQMLASGADVLASTGLEWFGADGGPTLEEFASASGYQAVQTASGLQEAGAGPVLAVFPSGELDSESPEITLKALALWAVERLSSDPDGFFLLVEHEGTDTASHHHASAALAQNLIALDETVGAVTAFAQQRGDILVIVVGDHETGGLQVDSTWSERGASWRDGYHSGEAVPIFAVGPGAEAFSGFLDNSEVGKALLALVKAGAPPSAPVSAATNAPPPGRP
ncbi:MAG TPA: alkaline phosphatase [Woeseiaceae bacterium]|nr:alkaline phosphatase [Woeseiaceae bacterium]